VVCDADVGPLIGSFQVCKRAITTCLLRMLQMLLQEIGALSTYFHGFPGRFTVGDSAVWLHFKVYHPGCVQVSARYSSKF
jgi:hypothetical protein